MGTGTAISLRLAVGMVAGAAALVLAGVYVARATPGGETKKTLSFSGTLTDTKGMALASPQKVTFTFKAGALSCSPPELSVAVDPATGSFQTDIDIGKCPASLFDGTDATVDVSVGAEKVVSAKPVSPVPYAKYADKVGSPDCPVGYDKDPSPASPFNAASILCKKGADEVVKVGVGASAFWIDRHEATVWADPTQTSGAALFSAIDDSSASFPKNGQALTPRYAQSVTGKTPSRNITWFQALEACAASGKRLPNRQEWLRAARGTRDPAAPGNDGLANAKCNTKSTATLRNTGVAIGAAIDASCVSDWGAQDMVGNLWEWTDEWYAGLGDASATYAGKSNWPDASYGGDGTWNIQSSAYNGVGVVGNLPAAALRGGGWYNGALAGVFTLDLDDAPSDWDSSVGFRCVLPR